MKTTTSTWIAALSLFMTLVAPTASFAKVDDFNGMINENSNAQLQLRKELNGHVESTRQAQNSARSAHELREDFVSSVNSPTDREFMTFKKEMVQYRPSEEKQMKRLADEIKALDSQF
jgi:outer membrane murein-binding lipoprotein Lpp